ncbi:MAG TPA: hypothetical protein VFK14_04930 [Solirubrobacterales bacterium]|nr:hypothetical protein [Solirubrobacterales bacterium]
MAELTTIEEKLAAVLGLAQATRKAAERVEETERRCTAATEMTATLGDDAGGLDGFEFKTTAEAGEVGRWMSLAKRNELAGEKDPYEES